MKKDKIVIAVITVVLLVLAGLSTWLYLKDRDKTPENGIKLIKDGKEKVVDVSELKLSAFSETVVNGKGEKKDVKGDGIKLADFIDAKDYSEVIVTADDEYSATVSKDEIGSAVLIIDEGKATLYVFGDENSKRNVKNVVKVEVK